MIKDYGREWLRVKEAAGKTLQRKWMGLALDPSKTPVDPNAPSQGGGVTDPSYIEQQRQTGILQQEQAAQKAKDQAEAQRVQQRQKELDQAVGPQQSQQSDPYAVE
jgi:hypothetical protein